MATMLLYRQSERSTANAVDLLAGIWRVPLYQYAAGAALFARGGSVKELIPLLSSEPASANSAAEEIDGILQDALLYIEDESLTDPVWLEVYSTGEAPRRALALNGYIQPLAEQYSSMFLDAGHVKATLALTRYPAWENTAARRIGAGSGTGSWLPLAGPPTYATASGVGVVSALGGTMDIPGRGALPGRIAQAKFTYSTGNVGKIWAGIRPYRDGYSSFNPVWDVYGASILDGSGDTVQATSISDYIGSGYLAITPSVADDLKLRYEFSLSDISATDHHHFFGTYHLLARYQVPSGTPSPTPTFGVQFRYGISNLSSLIPNNEVVLDSGEYTKGFWHIQPVGTITISPGDRSQRILDNWTLQCYVEQMGGAGDTLAIDELFLVPAEHYIHIAGTGLISSSGMHYSVLTHPNDIVVGGRYDGSDDMREPSETESTNWVVPKSGGTLVLVGRALTTAPSTTALSVSLDVYDRWSSWRHS